MAVSCGLKPLVNMNTIKTVNDLRHAMELCDKSDLTNSFFEIANALINDFGIMKGDRIYRFVEIEAYHNLTDGGKGITYKRISGPLRWFFHKSGVDLTFESDDSNYGGFLIRTIADGNRFICGPYNVVDELFDCFDATGSLMDFPRIVPLEQSSSIMPVKTWRYKIDNALEFRYTIPHELWEKPKTYQAYPWDCKGNLKKQ